MYGLFEKYNVHWAIEVENAFANLKMALISAHVATLLSFDKKFIVKTNASGKGKGVVLIPDKCIIAYIRKCLGPKQQTMYVYEREL